ncbi:MAG: choice-of-anchor D domain-containing protein [Nitrospirales bacterium]|nr:choice-of-anchor D domain-containing protein [Nitrospirales bacterium]
MRKGIEVALMALIVFLSLIAAAPLLHNHAHAEGGDYYGAHSMIYTNTPADFQETLFSKAAKLGTGFIRIDVQISEIFRDPSAPDWNEMDRLANLSRKYNLQLLGTLYSTPEGEGRCPSGSLIYKYEYCPPADYDRWAEWIRAIVGRYRDVIHYWEVWNEPNKYECTESRCNGYFYGNAAEYARLLSATYDAIKAADSSSRVLLGGIFMTQDNAETADWLMEVAAQAPNKFDIGNVHIRGSIERLPSLMSTFNTQFRNAGYFGPLWVTEHGYPSDAAYQSVPGYTGGELSQAQYYQESGKTLLQNGASRVFITLRDNEDLMETNRSEGLLSEAVDERAGNFVFTEKPSFPAVQELIRTYDPVLEDTAPAPAASLPSVQYVFNGDDLLNLVLFNTGTADLMVGSIVTTGTNASEFRVQNDTCSGQSIAPNGDCTFQISFVPLSSGSRSARMEIPTNISGTPFLTGVLSETGMSLENSGNSPSYDLKKCFQWWRARPLRKQYCPSTVTR